MSSQNKPVRQKGYSPRRSFWKGAVIGGAVSLGLAAAVSYSTMLNLFESQQIDFVTFDFNRDKISDVYLQYDARFGPFYARNAALFLSNGNGTYTERKVEFGSSLHALIMREIARNRLKPKIH